METAHAQQDLAFVKDIVQKTSQRIDAHAFHCEHWGLIVLIWYPLANWFWHQWVVARDAADAAVKAGIDATIHKEAMVTWLTCHIGIGVASVILGTILSIVRGAKLSKKPRLAGSNTFISNQLGIIVGANLVAGFILSGVAPANEFIAGENVPIVWGFVYANMAFMMGVAYGHDFLISGIAIFAGCITAIFLQDYNGYILGPVMGLGMVVPGLRAEARVRQLQLADAPSDSD
jgi:hypothetical protein